MQVDAEHKGAKPDYVHSALEASLRRLQTDHVDLYQLHAPDPETPIAETLGALDECVRAGKVREIGCSNFTVEQLREAEAAVADGRGTLRERPERVQPAAAPGRARRPPRVRAGRACRSSRTSPWRRGCSPGSTGAARHLRPGTRLVGSEAERGAAVRRHPRHGGAAHGVRREPEPHHGGARHRLDRGAQARGVGDRGSHLGPSRSTPTSRPRTGTWTRTNWPRSTR